jgi:hypothetical protein
MAPFGDGTLIYAYTRAQALADGVLHDVTMVARDAGFVYSVALTAALWHDIQNVPARISGITSVEGRLWDVLAMAYLAIRLAPTNGDRLAYVLHMPVGESGRRQYDVVLHCGPGDAGEPVITLMRPDES